MTRRKPSSETAKGARGSFQTAFERLGGAEALAEWGRDKPTEFYRLFARLIPLGGEGSGDAAFEVEIVRFSDSYDGDDPAA